jgi:hypothetical protein
VLEHLPREPEELYDYDVVLLLDPDPTDLDARWAATVRRWVEELGGGVLLQAGPHWTSRFLRDARLSDLVAILPVTPDPDADMRLSAQGTFRHRAGAVQLAAATHPLVSLHGDPTTNREVWRALPGAWWHLPVLRAKPVATVLLELADAAYANQYGPGVLMATQPVGAGHATFLGCDSTWRWRGSAEAYYNSFWVRLVRYLAQARQQGGSKRGRIVLDRESFSVGDYGRIEAQLLDEVPAGRHGRGGRHAAVGRGRRRNARCRPVRTGPAGTPAAYCWIGPAPSSCASPCPPALPARMRHS